MLDHSKKGCKIIYMSIMKIIFFLYIPIINPKHCERLFSWDIRGVVKLNVFLFVFYGNLTFCFLCVHRGINVTMPELFQGFVLYFILQIKTSPCRPVCMSFSSEHKKKKTKTKVKITFLWKIYVIKMLFINPIEISIGLFRKWIRWSGISKSIIKLSITKKFVKKMKNKGRFSS